jgi:hypothetical protein
MNQPNWAKAQAYVLNRLTAGGGVGLNPIIIATPSLDDGARVTRQE